MQPLFMGMCLSICEHKTYGYFLVSCYEQVTMINIRRSQPDIVAPFCSVKYVISNLLFNLST